jgi:hypothetical protein
MTFVSYIKTKPTATTEVATSFRPSDREISMIRDPTDGLGTFHYRWAGGFSQKPENGSVRIVSY